MIELNPIIVARKPISEKTVVDNVLEWGTGAINIDESRIGFVSEADKKESTQKNQHADFGTKPLTGNVIYGDYSMVQPKNYNPPGRFPANLIIDEEAGKMLDEQSGISKSTGGRGERKKGWGEFGGNGTVEILDGDPGFGDIGGASRFFKKVNYEDDEVIGVNVMSEVRLVLGDCLDKLKEMDDNSVDSIVTDPPYGLSFMGKQWDYDVPSVEIWQECMRVLKPGGHLLAFAGSRTYHRMAVRIEDAGFEIRDMISWLYGSGFPKSMDISKQIDKREGVEREVVGYDASKARPNKENFAKRTDRQPTSTAIEGWRDNGATITTPATDLAKQWSGWGTALKPAHEPVVMARKPISEKTVVDNVLEWGTGAINIDESRIGNEALEYRTTSYKEAMSGEFSGQGQINSATGTKSVEGRFPANLIIDEEAGKMLDEQSGISKSTGGRNGNKEGVGHNGIYGQYNGEVKEGNPGFGDVGGASRFFYCPKVGKSERNEGLDGFPVKQASSMPGRRNAEDMSDFKIDNDVTGRFVTNKQNTHPTVKPVDLMLYLIRLVTPTGGTTLDPFMGSGSTGKAAVRGGFGFIGIEREQEYFDIAEARIEYERNRPVSKSSDKKKNKTVEPKVEETLTKFFE